MKLLASSIAGRAGLVARLRPCPTVPRSTVADEVIQDTIGDASDQQRRRWFDRTFDQLTIDDFECYGIHFWGVVYCTKGFCRRCSHRKPISERLERVRSHRPPEQTHTPHRVCFRGFTESLRHELSETNVAVSASIRRSENTSCGTRKSARSSAAEAASVSFSTRLRRLPQRSADVIVGGSIEKPAHPDRERRSAIV